MKKKMKNSAIRRFFLQLSNCAIWRLGIKTQLPNRRSPNRYFNHLIAPSLHRSIAVCLIAPSFNCIIALLFILHHSYFIIPPSAEAARETLIEVSVEVAEINNRVARELGIKWVDTIRFGEILSKQSLTGVRDSAGNLVQIIDPSDRTPQDLPTSQPTKVPWDFPSLIRSGDTARFDPFIGELKALAERGAIKITSKPRILTKSGKKATFLSGGEFPVVTETATRINVAYKDFGIKLEIMPVELPDNFVDVQVEAEVSRLDFTQLVAGRYPILNTRRAKTQLVLKSEDTMALGGMVETKKSQGRIGIPFLKDIPVLGYLFGVRRNIDEESTVVIFLTPKIVKE